MPRRPDGFPDLTGKFGSVASDAKFDGWPLNRRIQKPVWRKKSPACAKCAGFAPITFASDNAGFETFRFASAKTKALEANRSTARSAVPAKKPQPLNGFARVPTYDDLFQRRNDGEAGNCDK